MLQLQGYFGASGSANGRAGPPSVQVWWTLQYVQEMAVFLYAWEHVRPYRVGQLSMPVHVPR